MLLNDLVTDEIEMNTRTNVKRFQKANRIKIFFAHPFDLMSTNEMKCTHLIVNRLNIRTSKQETFHTRRMLVLVIAWLDKWKKRKEEHETHNNSILNQLKHNDANTDFGM